jgi:hypothetical protein
MKKEFIKKGLSLKRAPTSKYIKKYSKKELQQKLI